MKKIWFLSISAMIAMSLLAACSSASADNASEAAGKTGADTTETLKKIDNLELLTASSSGTWVPIGAGIADKFNEFYDGFPMTAVPSSGSLANPPLIAAGDGEFGMSYAPFLIGAANGTGAFTGVDTMENLRAICALQPTVIQIVADVDDSVKSIGDAIEQKVKLDVGVPPTGNASNFLANSIFRSSGLGSVEDVKSWGGSVYYASGSNLTDAWKDRHVNSYFQIQTVPSSGITESLTGRSGKILAVDGNTARSLIEKEGFSSYVIPAESYPGQAEEIDTVALPIVIFCTEDMDEEIVYNLCKAIYENAEELKMVHSSFEEFDVNSMAKGCGIELHSGAERFYKEIGLLE